MARGGRREGSGRKRKTVKAVSKTYILMPNQIAWLQEEADRMGYNSPSKLLREILTKAGAPQD